MSTLVYHQPVLLPQTIEGLAINPEGTYVDLTFGGGGHSRAILDRLGASGRLIAFDQDPDSAQQAQEINDPRFFFIHANFRFFAQFLYVHDILQVEGILADLGISSYQLNQPQRGFANRLDGPLDMRMNPHHNPIDAQTVLNTYSEHELAAILRQYGEISNAKKLASRIAQARALAPITTTLQLKEIAQACVPPKNKNQYYAKVFQAFRITVNDELEALREMLLQVPDRLKPQGRLVVLAYHALEDRPVKNFIKTGNLDGKLEKDFYGNIIRPLSPLHSKATKASEEEIKKNNRARSARLRIAEKI